MKLINSKDEIIKKIYNKIQGENNQGEIDLLLKEKNNILNEKL